MKQAIILVLGLSGVLRMATLGAAVKSGSTTERVIQVTAKKFDFSPGEITVKKGEPVVLELTSLDREHGFYLPDFGVNAKVKPREVTRVAFTPGKAGKFPFACDVVCGSGHEEMSGTLVVTE
jgi:cytochrome c oxidase subunit II